MTNLDDDGNQFVSMIEAKDYPFWGVVFHPEKAPFEDLPMRVLEEDEKV